METQAANDDLDTYAMFKDIRDWSLNSMATGEVVEGSPAWITMNRIAERALPGTINSRRR
jgi:endo-1,4-beta-D-glucanase Y